jgi:CHAT domain-containing protein
MNHENAYRTICFIWLVCGCMERFYRLQAEKKMPRAVALATVQREFIQSGQPGRMEPYFWAPFVLMGNWQ